MPKFPNNMDAARAHAEKQREARADRERKDREAWERDEQMIRDLTNRLRAEEGLPPLGPEEPVQAIICRRGRR